ncbi:MAG: nucleotidyltransferase domain-containing protein, partial [Methanothrix sp.]|uniref:nucleotidyltransferase domain-containing protein n=1 Tax=Methanothrix sp. TaxID=90426 RepID=UPI00260002C1
MKARIRDFFETNEGWIFAVSDYNHSHGLRSLLRYIPDPSGERAARGIRYRKMDFDQAFEFLRQNRPDYVQDLHVVPEYDVLRLYDPSQGLRAVAEKDPKTEKIARILNQAGVPWEEMGITGSRLIGLQAPASDIDFVVYGPMWWKARDIVDRAKKEGSIQDLDEETWKKIYAKRKPEISLEEFMLHEKRKGNRGIIDGTYFDLLFTRDWNQIQPLDEGRPVGQGLVEAQVTDCEFAFDSPAIFRLDHPEV